MSSRAMLLIAIFQGGPPADSTPVSLILAIVLLLVAVVVVAVVRSANKKTILPKRPTILLCGATGVGKSTLINILLGEQLARTAAGEPVTQNTERVATDTSEFVFYDSKGLEVEDASQTYLLLMSDLLRLRFGPNAHSQIDLVLMCIQEPQGRIDDAHLEIAGLCQDLRIPLGIALTKTEGNVELEAFAKKAFTTAVFVRRIRSLPIHYPALTVPAEGIEEIRNDIRAAASRDQGRGHQRARRGRDAQMLADSARRLAAAGTANDDAWVNFSSLAWMRLNMQGLKWEQLLKAQRELVKQQVVPGFLKRKLNTRFDNGKIDAALSRRLLPIMMRRFGDESSRLQFRDVAQARNEAITSFENSRPYRSRF